MLEFIIMDLHKINKIAGYGLLAAGLLLIVMPLWQTYSIFTGQSLPPQVFKQEEIKAPSQNNNSFNIEAQIQAAFTKAMPLDLINNTLNLSSWMILMFILMIGGGQI